MAMRNLKHSVFWPPFLILLLSVAYSLIDNEGFTQMTTQANAFLLDKFGWLYSFSALTFFGNRLECGNECVLVRIAGGDERHQTYLVLLVGSA